MNQNINVVIIGIGHDHAHDVFKTITRDNSGYNLLGIVIEEDNNGNYEKYKSEYDNYHHFQIDEVLSLSNLDAVLIESDDTLLSKYASLFINEKIPVHMDKPGGQDKEEFDELINNCKKNDVPLHIGYMYRYNLAIKEAIKICKSNRIGKILSINADMSTYHNVEKRKWLNKFKGGMMNFLGCHLIDIVISILGKPDSVISLNTRSEEGVGIDMAKAILKYGSTCSEVNTSAVEHDGFSRRHITIIGEKMTIDICPTELFVDGTNLVSKVLYKSPVIIDNVPIGEVTYGPFDRYISMFDEFYKIVRKEIDNPYSLEHELLVHDVLLLACNEYGKETKL